MYYDHTDAIRSLCSRMHVLRVRYQLVFNELSPASPNYIPMAESLAAGLQEQLSPAVQLLLSVVDFDEMSTAIFWSTSLGRLAFHAGAYPYTTCTPQVAANVLGVTPQAVSSLVKRGRLHKDADGGVLVDGVRARVSAAFDALDHAKGDK